MMTGTQNRNGTLLQGGVGIYEGCFISACIYFQEYEFFTAWCTIMEKSSRWEVTIWNGISIRGNVPFSNEPITMLLWPKYRFRLSLPNENGAEFFSLIVQ